MTKTAILIFFLGTIFGYILAFFQSLNYFTRFSFENLVLPSAQVSQLVNSGVVNSGENSKISDQIVSEFRKQKETISKDIYTQLKNSIKNNFTSFFIGN